MSLRIKSLTRYTLVEQTPLLKGNGKTVNDDTKKFCLTCAGSKKEGIITPSLDGRCPVCSSDSLLSLDVLTKLLGSKTNSPGLSVLEENSLISEFGDSNEIDRRPASKPVRPNMVLHEVCITISRLANDSTPQSAILRCVRFAVSEREAIAQASCDPTQPWYLHDGKLRESDLKSRAVNRNYSNPLKE